MTKSSKKAAKKATSKKQQVVETKAAETKPVETPVQEAAAETKTARKVKVSKHPKERKPRTGTKAATILQMIQREGGASVEELAKATGWQKHSVRGFISGNLHKKQGLKVDSIKRENGTHAYTLVAAK